MGAQIVSIFQRQPRQAPAPSDWTQQELAEFYRVESALIRAGLRIETDRGMSDENEPWFVFMRAEDGEVVIHFARIDGEYLIAGPAYERVARGFDFNALVRNMIARHPLIQPRRRDGNVFMHPAALLIAIVGTAFFKTGEAKAMDDGKAPAARKPDGFTLAHVSTPPTVTAQGSAPAQSVYLEANQALTILAGAMFVLEQRSDYRGAAAIAGTQNSNVDISAEPGPALLPQEAKEMAQGGAAALEQASAVLSLVAILSTLDQPAGAVATPASPSNLPVISAEIVQPVLSDGSGQGQAPIYMEVQLRPGAVPIVESVQLVREIADGRGFEKIAVIALEKLPEAIAAIIASGSDFGITPAPTDSMQTPTPDPDSPPLGAGGDVAVGIPPVVGGSTVPPAPSMPLAPDAYKAMAQKLIAYFVAHVPAVEILTAGSEVVFYDTRVITHAQILDHVDSITFHFADGSSISLVGEHSTLYQDLG